MLLHSFRRSHVRVWLSRLTHHDSALTTPHSFELLANRSAEEPRGILTPEVFMQFFSYARDENGALQYTYGHERIPDNWYRRANDNPWTLTDIVISTSQQCQSYPSNCKVGGNTGEVNSVRVLKAINHPCSRLILLLVRWLRSWRHYGRLHQRCRRPPRSTTHGLLHRSGHPRRYPKFLGQSLLRCGPDQRAWCRRHEIGASLSHVGRLP